MAERSFRYGPVTARVIESARPGWYEVSLVDDAGNRFEIAVAHFDGLYHMGAARDAIMHLAVAHARPEEYRYRAHVLYTNLTGSEILEGAQNFGWRAVQAAQAIEEAQSAAWGRHPELGAGAPEAWRKWFPEFKVPRQISDLVRKGLLRDTTKCHDASPNFEAFFPDGQILTIWVEHPDPDKRIGQEARYGLTLRTAEDPLSRPLMETDSVGEVVEIVRRTFRERGGPRWTA